MSPAELEARSTALLNAGKTKQAASLVQTHAGHDWQRLLFQGRVLKSQGQLQAALPLLQQALALAPNALPVLRELADTEARAQHYSAAEKHLKTLLKRDPNPVMRQSYVARLRQIKQQKPLHYSLSFSIEPSTNINQGTYEALMDTVIGDLVVDEASKARSGVGVTTGGNAALRLWQSGPQTLTLKAGLSVIRYPDYPDLNQRVSDLALSFQHRHAAGVVTLAPYWQSTRVQDGAHTRIAGASLSFQRAHGPRWSSYVSVRGERRRYQANPRKNGWAGALQASVRHHLTRTVFWDASLTLQRDDAEAAHLAHWGGTGTVKLSRQFASGHLGSISVFGGGRWFDGDFPLTTEARQDRVLGLSLEVLFPTFGASALQPKVSCTARRTRSNIALYNQNSNSCALGLERAF